MPSTTRCKSTGTGGTSDPQRRRPHHQHCVWYLMAGVVIISSVPAVPVAAHAPPRSAYYGRPGHQVQPREPFKHIPASLMFGDSTPGVGGRGGGGGVAANRLYDTPTCGQLKQMWKSSLRSLSDNNVMNNNKHNVDSNDIPLILNNPYYMAFLWQQSLQNTRPHFGTIVSEPTRVVETPVGAGGNARVVPVVTGGAHHRTPGRGLPAKGNHQQPQHSQSIPGDFMDRPSKVGVVYGHVIHSPEEAVERQQSDDAGGGDERHRSSSGAAIGGTFGAFAADSADGLADSIAESKSNKNSNNNNNDNNNADESGRKTKQQQRTGSSNSFSTADEFFKSGVWHEKPVVPSVSFQRIH